MNKNVELSTKKTASAEAVRRSSVGWGLKMLSASLDNEMNSKLKPLGLNLAQFAILMTLLESGGLTQVELGKRISLPGYATTRNLDVLEKSRLIKRQPHETSRRSLRVHVTDEGRAVGHKLFPIVREVNDELLSTLSNNEIVQFEMLLTKLLQGRGLVG